MSIPLSIPELEPEVVVGEDFCMRAACVDLLDGTPVPRHSLVRVIYEEGDYVSVTYRGHVRVLGRREMQGLAEAA